MSEGTYNVPQGPTSMGQDEVATAAKAATKTKELWLNAWKDHLAGLKAFSCCMSLCDVNGDGDYKLVVADAQKRLKVFSGTNLVNDQKLLVVPTSVVAFYMDYREEVRRPCIAVGSGPFIFIFKNLRPFYKFTLPPVEVLQAEQDAWSMVQKGSKAGVALLEKLRDDGVALTSMSQELLSFDSDEGRATFAATVTLPLQQMTVITALAVLYKDRDEATALGCPIVGTENCRVLILDPTGAAINKKVTLPSVPVHIIVTGLYDVEYRIIVACRNGVVYTIKNGELLGVVIEVGSQPVAMARMENQIVIGAMNNTLQYFQLKGKKVATVYLPAAITDMCALFQDTVRQSKAVIVALANGEVRVYIGKALLNKMQVHDVVTGMQFGRYGREESTLVLAMKSGTIMIKMLPRTATIEAANAQVNGPPPEQDMPLKVPRRTELYVQQTAREREFAVDMHRVFQRDLAKLRLATARAYVKILTDGQGNQSYNMSTSLRVTAHVQGLGPQFKIRLNIQNTGTKPLTGVPVIFTFNQEIYRVPKPYLVIPALVPLLMYVFDVAVECIDEQAGSDVIRLYVCNPGSAVPIITALVNMPVADFLMANQ